MTLILIALCLFVWVCSIRNYWSKQENKNLIDNIEKLNKTNERN